MKLNSCTSKSALQYQYPGCDFIREVEVLNVNKKLSNLIPLYTGEKKKKNRVDLAVISAQIAKEKGRERERERERGDML
jgi:hypothetical protein